MRIKEMRSSFIGAFLVVSICARAYAQGHLVDGPGCPGVSAQQCVALALDAMGGREKLRSSPAYACRQ